MRVIREILTWSRAGPESRAAVEDCHRAGIVVHMLTGDHPSTATAIAREVGIIPDCDVARLPRHTVVTAVEFDKLSDDEVDAMEELPRVIGRCSPETKVRMIEALHRRKKFAAMSESTALGLLVLCGRR